MSNDLAMRLDKLESIEEIRQLAAKYALSLDMRDLDAHVNLFAEDIRVGKEKSGRAELKRWLDATLREQFTGTSHHIGGHVIEFTDTNNAHGVVYSKNEHEADQEWVIMQMMYWDNYERIDKHWYFRRRLPLYWYATDLNKPPIGEQKMRWPGVAPYDGAWHDIWPSWQEFWDHPPDKNDLPEVMAPAPFNEFLLRMRRNAKTPKIKVK